MAVTTTKINRPLNPRGQDQSPKGYNRAALYSGKALDFDGVNDSVDLDGFTLSGTTATFVFNLKADSPSFTSKYVFDTTQRWRVGQTDTANKFGFHDAVTWRNSIQELTAGEWYNIAIVVNGTDVEFLWNGQSIGDTFSGVNPLSWASLTDFKLGSNLVPSGGYFDGQIAGFKIFNTALTAAQVSDLYNNPEKIVPTGVEDTALKLWLPMMEGAGTTAYDGSGNGNHGTISGATYVNGVGSPVAQTAVIDWNKGSNLFLYSNDYSQSNWSKANATIVANSGTSPDGSNNASLLYATASGSISYIYNVLTESSAVYTISAFVKASGRNICWIYIQGGATYGNAYFDLSDQSVEVSTGSSSTLTATITSVGNDWYKISATTGEPISISAGSGIGVSDAKGSLNVTADGTNGILVYGLHLHSGTAGPYIPTLSTAQTTPVLLPQGLTSGRDITGVNLFENVRKQGALNLDGNSWAEVHDNASLDITTAITLEAWFDNTNAYDSNRYLFDKSANATSGFELRLTSQTNAQIIFRNLSPNAVDSAISSTGWIHYIGVYNGSNITTYVNGSQVSSVNVTGTISANTDVLTIGGDNNYSPYSLNKPIAQPRIYNRALTAEEVERNYNAGKNIYK